MIILYFHLQPQNKYELFHINLTSLHCTGRYRERNKLTSLPVCGFIAQLVEHRTGIAEVTGSNPVGALIFFRLPLSNCLYWKIYCDDHSSLSNNSPINNFIFLFSLYCFFNVSSIRLLLSFTICLRESREPITTLNVATYNVCNASLVNPALDLSTQQ